jgi:hypothetical protein
VATEGVEVLKVRRRARVDEEGGVLGAGDDIVGMEGDVENALAVAGEDRRLL